MRGFKSPISVTNTQNNFDTTCVCKCNSIVFQEYFKQKAKMLGVKKLQRYHLYAPLTIKVSHQKRFTYDEAGITGVTLRNRLNDLNNKFN